ncbi:hypothetical protein CRE_21187 [Caenorhabditis remanei]|uniref:Uncharacterized protein n=1 Tax=Caenorhabditis remanei TaxID=31234 RepID=E3MF99_CAERE|nr:hypothetical protein CRE_21187 [Caenorhabditis remanei]
MEGDYIDEDFVVQEKISEKPAETLETVENPEKLFEKPEKDGVSEPKGRFKWTPHTFKMGKLRWQMRMMIRDRMEQVDKIIDAFYCTKTNIRHRRFDELMWFARRLEETLFHKSSKFEIYEKGIQTIVTLMNVLMQADPAMRHLIDENEIPSTEQLEKLFTLKAERHELIEDDYLEDGVAEIELIKEDRFRHTDLILDREPPADMIMLNLHSGSRIFAETRPSSVQYSKIRVDLRRKSTLLWHS